MQVVEIEKKELQSFKKIVQGAIKEISESLVYCEAEITLQSLSVSKGKLYVSFEYLYDVVEERYATYEYPTQYESIYRTIDGVFDSNSSDLLGDIYLFLEQNVSTNF